MDLSDIYQTEGIDGLRRLAKATDSNVQYLRQIATGFRGKRPSPELAEKLVEADDRLSFHKLLLGKGQSAA